MRRPGRSQDGHEPGGPAQVDTLAEQTLHWFVLAALTTRLILTLTTVGNAADIAKLPTGKLAVVTGVVAAVDLALLAAFSSGRFGQALRSPLVLGVDVASSAAVNLWTAVELPHAVLLDPAQDVFWLYWVGTVALWSVLRGPRVGGFLAVASVPLLVWMAAVNRELLDTTNVSGGLVRIGWVAASYALALVFVAMARQGAQRAVAEGLRAGRESARADGLRTLHDTVLQTFGLIAQWAGDHRQGAEDQLDRITTQARRQAEELRTALPGAGLGLARPSAPLQDELVRLARRQAEHGLEVVLVTDRLAASLPANPALVGAAQEALQNVRKHAGVATAWLEAISSPAEVEVIVSDRGVGFDAGAVSEGFGMPQSLRQRLSDEGGCAEVISTPGQGTTVRLRLARDQAQRARTLADRAGAVEWTLMAPLLLRAVFIPMVAASCVWYLGLRAALPILLALGGLLAWNLVLLDWARKPSRHARLATRMCLATDMAVTAAFGVFAAAALPKGDVLIPGPDVPWVYVSQTAGLWAVVAGVRTGIALIAGGAALGVLMVWANGMSLGEAGPTPLLGRLFGLCTGVVLVWTIVTLAQRGARAGAAQGQEAGRAAERAGVLLDLHWSALRTLDRISELARRDGDQAEESVQRARALALAQTEQLRDALVADDASRRPFLLTRLTDLARVYSGRGLQVELVTPELQADPPEPVIDALIESATWALDDVCARPSTPQVVVWASAAAAEAEVTVRDQGQGVLGALEIQGALDGDTGPPATAGRARARMAAVGGTADLWSAPGRGTRVRLIWRAK